MEAGEGLELPPPTQGKLLIIYHSQLRALFLSLYLLARVTSSLIKSTFSLHAFAGGDDTAAFLWNVRAHACKFRAACANLRLAINSRAEKLAGG